MTNGEDAPIIDAEVEVIKVSSEVEPSVRAIENLEFRLLQDMPQLVEQIEATNPNVTCTSFHWEQLKKAFTDTSAGSQQGRLRKLKNYFQGKGRGHWMEESLESAHKGLIDFFGGGIQDAVISGRVAYPEATEKLKELVQAGQACKNIVGGLEIK